VGKGGGGTQATNTIQNADPWVGAQPFIKDVLAQAGTQFRSPLPQFFPQNTVGPQATETLQAQQLASNRATAGSPLEQAAQAENMRTVQGQYLGLSPSQPLWNTTMRGDFVGTNPADPFNRAVAGGAFVGTNPAEQYLQQAAGGSFLNSNPHLDAMVQKAFRPITTQFTDVALPGISSMFSQAGRYGSGAHQTAVSNVVDSYGRTIGDTAAGIYGNNFANERALQQNAAGMFGDLNQAQRAMQMQAAGTVGATNLAERGMQLQAANEADQAFGRERMMQSQATGMAPTTAATDWRNIGMLGNVGADREAFAQNLVNDAVQRFNFTQMQPQQRLAEYARLIAGNPTGTATNSTQIAQLPPPNRTANAAGGALAGGSVAGTLGMSTGWGALIGGLLGAFS